MLLIKDNIDREDFKTITELEWLETNALGGWAGSSLAGCNTRRYHGLLMAAIPPPANRKLLVSKLDETIITGGNRYELGTNDYGTVISPKGFQYLKIFRKDFFPEWIYECANIRLKKTVSMVTGENTTMIRYEVLSAPETFNMELLPLIADRGYHELKHAGQNIYWNCSFREGIFHNQPHAGATDIFISVPGSTFEHRDDWYYHFNYLQEKYRGLDFTEDLFNHGIFTVELKQGDILNVMISVTDPAGRNAEQLFQREKDRKFSLLKAVPGDLLRQLVLAADQFIVQRDDMKTVIAGYHWFTDWGRDTMISLPGLCLHTERYTDAKMIISVFAKSVSMGMLPNRFMDNNDPPEYNNVDATLWYFIAVYAYLQKTGDREFVLGEILAVLKNILDWHIKGTRFNIHADDDGLLYAGEKGQQLTWMDARVGDHVITPRMGKPVEIEALWFNSLKIAELLFNLNGETALAHDMMKRSAQVKICFEEKFWNETRRCLYDTIDENGVPDASLRPNQIFAISLPFNLVEGEKAEAILAAVQSRLYTPVGLRSLDPDDPRYGGHYGGNQQSRDDVYHQGTVWSWLLGPFLEAGIKYGGPVFRVRAINMVEQFAAHLNEACIGSVSEIFDGDPPHHPRGCVAQAWGVAEILRVVKTYSLFHAGS